VNLPLWCHLVTFSYQFSYFQLKAVGKATWVIDFTLINCENADQTLHYSWCWTLTGLMTDLMVRIYTCLTPNLFIERTFYWCDVDCMSADCVWEGCLASDPMPSSHWFSMIHSVWLMSHPLMSWCSSLGLRVVSWLWLHEHLRLNHA